MSSARATSEGAYPEQSLPQHLRAGNPGSKTARVLTQLSWLGSIAAEGALFVMIGSRNACEVGIGRNQSIRGGFEYA